MRGEDERLKSANELLTVIASCGRKFFRKGDAVARFVESLRRIREGWLVVRLQLDWATKSTTTAAFGRTGSPGIR